MASYRSCCLHLSPSQLVLLIVSFIVVTVAKKVHKLAKFDLTMKSGIETLGGQTNDDVERAVGVNAYKQLNSKGGCCISRKQLHEYCEAPTSIRDGPTCQKACNTEDNCKAYFYGNRNRKKVCNMVTTFADWCPSGWRQNEKGKTGNIDPNAKCTFGWMTAMDFHGCFLKETKVQTPKSCCWKVYVSVSNEKDRNSKLTKLYGTYVMQNGLVNGRNHYKQVNGGRVIAYCTKNKQWSISTNVEDASNCHSRAHTDDYHTCVQDTGHAWRYLGTANKWVNAGKGLGIWCASKK